MKRPLRKLLFEGCLHLEQKWDNGKELRKSMHQPVFHSRQPSKKVRSWGVQSKQSQRRVHKMSGDIIMITEKPALWGITTMDELTEATYMKNHQDT